MICNEERTPFGRDFVDIVGFGTEIVSIHDRRGRHRTFDIAGRVPKRIIPMCIEVGARELVDAGGDLGVVPCRAYLGQVVSDPTQRLLCSRAAMTAIGRGEG